VGEEEEETLGAGRSEGHTAERGGKKRADEAGTEI